MRKRTKQLHFYFKTYWEELKSIATPFLLIGWIGGWFADIFTVDLQAQLNTPFRQFFTIITSIILIVYLFYSGFKAYKTLETIGVCFIFHRSQSVFQTKEVSPILGKYPLPIVEEFDTSPYHTPAMIEWKNGMKAQEEFFNQKLLPKLSEMNRLNYLGIVEIPFAIHLGYLIGDSIQVRFFHRQRLHRNISNSWKWVSQQKPSDWEVSVDGLGKRQPKDKQVMLLVQQSSVINKEEINQLNLSTTNFITVTVPKPSIYDLVSEDQIFEMGKKIRMILDKITQSVSIHLFAAVPTPTAFVIGQNIKATMHPPIFIYYYHKAKTPPYQLAYTLNIKRDN